ncbi:MAG: 50S ribosomal protein L18 [Nitrospiraceae bacterium]|nr:MAG: 50S ribosomal protein L18 [Nitrospiraceae bacterium]UCH44947.1 MAG: 50S ribosomal protein L18 [Nitrospiraceae bacterium]
MSFNKEKARKKRQFRVRKKISGSPECPRLNVFRSINHIYAQLIDDFNGKTLVSASSTDKELKGKLNTGGNIDAAKVVGTLIAKRAVDKGVKKVVFDRGGNLYHGRVKALADGAREGGLEF